MEGMQLILGIIPVAIILLYIFFSSFRILREYERGVIFRFGRRTNAIFNPGTPMDDIAVFIRKNVKPRGLITA